MEYQDLHIREWNSRGSGHLNFKNSLRDIKSVMGSLREPLEFHSLMCESWYSIFSICQKIQEDNQTKHSKLRRIHLSSGPSVICSWCKSYFLVLPPLFLQRFTIVPPVLRTIPFIESTLLGLRFNRKTWIISHHSILFLIGFVILQQHSVFLGSSSAFFVIDWIWTWFPEVVPWGRTSRGTPCGELRDGSMSCQQPAGQHKSVHVSLVEVNQAILAWCSMGE